MRISQKEKIEEEQEYLEQLREFKEKEERIRLARSKKKSDPYDDPRFYKQSFNTVFRQYFSDLCKNSGVKMP